MAMSWGRVQERGLLLGWSFALFGLALFGAALIALQLLGGALVLIWVGVPVTLGILPVVRSFANLHRSWAGRHLGEEIPEPYRPLPEHLGELARLRAAVKDPATWRDHLWLWVNATAGAALTGVAFSLWLSALWYLALPVLWLLFPDLRELLSPAGPWADGTNWYSYLAAPVVGVLLALLAWRATPPVMTAYARLTRLLLAPAARTRLEERVEHLRSSRADTVDAQAAEIRRIERDLHDGAQARLVALGMHLGMAEEVVDSDPAAAKDLLAEARLSTVQALNELRDLVRGIHPPVLADRGLDGVIRAIALAVPLRVDVDSVLRGRLEPPLEAAAYFAVAESLTNAAKHGGGDRAWVIVRHEAGRLRMQVGDNGNGGARLVPGGGLSGIERRLSAFDGILHVSSPAGGPTTISMEIPCKLAERSPAAGSAGGSAAGSTASGPPAERPAGEPASS